MQRRLIVAAATLLLCAAAPAGGAAAAAAAAAGDDWPARVHARGACAMRGFCGRRADGDPLPCPDNGAAAPLDAAGAAALAAVCPRLAAEVGAAGGAVCCDAAQLDRLASQIQVASIFLAGCPACDANFKHLFCLLTCSPDQSAFTNVTRVQAAPRPLGPGAPANATAAAEVDVAVSAALGGALYDSCKDVVYPAANVPAMAFVGGGAKDAQGWLDFLGTVKDARFPPAGSPFQMNFPPEGAAPAALAPLRGDMAGCGDAELRCSCGDCPAAPGCAPPPPPPPPEPRGCAALGVRGPSCWELTCGAAYAALLACLPGFVRRARRQQAEAAAAAGLAEPLLGTPPRRKPRHGAAAAAGAGEAGPSTSAAAAALVGGLDPAGRGLPPQERLLQRGFHALGLAAGRRPGATLALAVLAVGAAAAGLPRLRLVSAPEELWVGPSSQAAREKAAYDAAFGPFFRINQLILTTTPGAGGGGGGGNASLTPSGLPRAVTDANIRLLFDVHDALDALTARVNATHYATLADVCVRPGGGPRCATQSLAQFWHMSREAYEHGDDRTGGAVLAPGFCLSHWSTACLADYGGPVEPGVVLGGFPAGAGAAAFRGYEADATSLVVTLPLDASPRRAAAAAAWEAAFVEAAAGPLAARAAAAGMRLSFSAQRSVGDELARQGTADVPTVAASYAAMLAYVAAALGAYPRRCSLGEAAARSRAGLALGGVGCVAAAVAGAFGLAGWAGVGASLIASEVVPFLVLAVGVDNMFILAAAAADVPRREAADGEDDGEEEGSDSDEGKRGGGGGGGSAWASPLSARRGGGGAPVPPAAVVARALAATGPSIALAAACEVAAFACGALSSMPALRDFSAVAAAAVALDFALQVTAFPALLALDIGRMDAGRADCAPCVRPAGRPVYGSSSGEDEPGPDEEEEEEDFEAAAAAAPGSPGTPRAAIAAAARQRRRGARRAARRRGARLLGVTPALRWYVRRVHAPALRRPAVRAAVLAAFGAALAAAGAAIPRVGVGLDQAVALPADSYLQAYFRDVATVLRVGPPVMFVVRGLNVSDGAPDAARVCASAGCDPASLLARVAAAARAPWASRLAGPATSWLDDFRAWLSPAVPQCCRVHRPGGQEFLGVENGDGPGAACPPPDAPPCADDPGACADCAPCLAPGALPRGGAPAAAQYRAYLPRFLAAAPTARCAKGGAGAYDDALARDGDGAVVGLASSTVAASAFRARHVALASQADFIGALAAARGLAARAARDLGLDVFAYSPFHVFFEQYLSLGGEALALLGTAGAAVFVLLLAATGSPAAAALTLGTLASMLACLAGAAPALGVQLNAVSLVNLVMALGIGVEFCAHTLHAFMEARARGAPPDDAAAAALEGVGASVLAGVALTKVVGVAALAAARTTIFRVYYFRMYAALVVAAAAHGFLLLPVLLATFSPAALGGR